MNCEEFQKQLDSVVESRRVPTESLREHGVHCPEQSCQARWREYLLLERLLGPWKFNTHSIDLTSRIKDRLNTVRVSEVPAPMPSLVTDRTSAPRRSSHLAVLISMTGVAVLLLALLTSLQRSTDRHLVSTRSTPVIPVESAVSGVTNLNDPDEQALQEISSKCVGWVEGATHKLTDAVTYVISPSNSPMDLMPPMRDPAGWLKTWGERLEPIEDSLDRTLRQLLDESANPMGHAGDRTS